MLSPANPPRNHHRSSLPSHICYPVAKVGYPKFVAHCSSDLSRCLVICLSARENVTGCARQNVSGRDHGSARVIQWDLRVSLTNAERKTLLVAGAAAGMSATFGSPVAAALLAVELLLFEWKPRSFIPVALASATAAIVRVPLLGAGPLFPVSIHLGTLGAPAVSACIACGLLAGGLSALLTLSVYAFEDLFGKLPIHWMWWPALGGIIIGVGGLIYPPALGVGYDVIRALLRGELVGPILLLLLAVKWTIWSASLGSGTSGGVLAPLLIMGAALGGFEAHWFPNQGMGFGKSSAWEQY